MEPGVPEEPDGSGKKLVIWLLIGFAATLVALVVAALIVTAGAGRDEDSLRHLLPLVTAAGRALTPR